MSDLQKVLTFVESTDKKLIRLEAMLCTILQHIEETKINQETADINESKDNKKPKTIDIVTFIKNSYAENQNFFGNDVSEEEISKIRQQILDKAGKKTIPADELNKKIAHAIWKEHKNEFGKKYQELKKQATTKINTPDAAPDVPPKAKSSRSKTVAPVSHASDSDNEILGD
jgi:hypothetical protein